MNFVRFRESNDWEGGSWNFWLQLYGNEEQIDRLAWKLKDLGEEEANYGGDFPYTLHARDIEPEYVVDKLVKYADENYMLSDNKVTGKFTCPDDLGDAAEKLYKGGIREFFVAEP